MKIIINNEQNLHENHELLIIPTFCKQIENNKYKLTQNGWPKEIIGDFQNSKLANNFDGTLGRKISLSLKSGTSLLLWGMGEKKLLNAELIRKEIAKIYLHCSINVDNLSIWMNELKLNSNYEAAISSTIESTLMTDYKFEVHKSKKSKRKEKQLELILPGQSKNKKKYLKIISNTTSIVEGINWGRDLINEAPNILNPIEMARRICEDAKHLHNVTVKLLNKAKIKKEKMNLFLSVNEGSNYEPRLVELTYTPKTKAKKHIILVGKGLTFDSGGYSLKPSASIINMKFDMAGAATVYAAFRNAVKLNPKVKISCLLGITDNAVSNTATYPDSIVKSRKGTTVEILNTDAEGRLVLADLLDYACDQTPDVIIDCATLTGAVLVALGNEICGVMSNNKKLTNDLLKSSHTCDEYMWELPIIKEFREEIKSPVADLKNIGSSRFGGSSKAAAFLEHFIKDNISWAHLDIAGIADQQTHLPYCPKKGASGLIIRTLTNYLTNA